jgi:hypothetical protein
LAERPDEQGCPLQLKEEAILSSQQFVVANYSTENFRLALVRDICSSLKDTS